MHNYAFILSVIQKLHGFHVKNRSRLQTCSCFAFSDDRPESVFFQKGFYNFTHIHFVIVFGRINLLVDGIVQETLRV